MLRLRRRLQRVCCNRDGSSPHAYQLQARHTQERTECRLWATALKSPPCSATTGSARRVDRIARCGCVPARASCLSGPDHARRGRKQDPPSSRPSARQPGAHHDARGVVVRQRREAARVRERLVRAHRESAAVGWGQGRHRPASPHRNLKLQVLRSDEAGVRQARGVERLERGGRCARICLEFPCAACVELAP